ncbi:hypothetical protein [Pseudoxanthomonas sp.]|uniref:hypothetical protein n=1 Tax=Pseudoxanthomonas sp. TaxID=1871049 RepID=UPI0028C48CA2|nr:hypothetical protein [Pseudoxanthomonas sp.]
MVSSPASSSPAPAALAAFLRGCERRGAVFAELQCGNADRGDVALAAALRAFRGKAAALPMADWPVRFWALLAATPQLRADGPAAQWPDAFAALARPATADRAALLLRLAGGLQEAEAADALGLDGAAYRDALARACPRDSLGHPDAGAWRALADAIQQHLRELPNDRLATLARLREDALAGTRLPPVEAKAPAPAVARTPRRWPWILSALVLLAALAAGLWWWRGSGLSTSSALPQAIPTDEDGVSPLPPDPMITSTALPADNTPLPAPAEAVAPASHPDFQLLADADDEARAREADFLAWYVAGAGATAAPSPDADAGGADAR